MDRHSTLISMIIILIRCEADHRQCGSLIQLGCSCPGKAKEPQLENVFAEPERNGACRFFIHVLRLQKSPSEALIQFLTRIAYPAETLYTPTTQLSLSPPGDRPVPTSTASVQILMQVLSPSANPVSSRCSILRNLEGRRPPWGTIGGYHLVYTVKPPERLVKRS
ncbi:hypothetical protein FIBSPDRAFT_881149 [Athelia psychrophila]|uniref:Uncharacterized protein n=1 Tax=Athelia psychrophila TaxID=1759441 RepID=A0A166XCQ2_9AGAM|nr:hypothetical protein FIBSPDRAFT_881149 [Fibularhizoctonia sp. CBS 109695]